MSPSTGIPFKCPKCGASGTAQERLAGRVVKCPKCASPIQLGKLPQDVVREVEQSVSQGNAPADSNKSLDELLAGIDDYISQPADVDMLLAEMSGPVPTAMPPGFGSERRFVYSMVQIPPTVVVQQSKGSDAARYLENVVNEYAGRGWEFYRVDQIGVEVSPGCLAAILFVRAETKLYHVITFRRREI